MWGGMRCGGMGEKKKSTLRWFGHIERMENKEFVKKVYQSSVGVLIGGEGHLEDGKTG